MKRILGAVLAFAFIAGSAGAASKSKGEWNVPLLIGLTFPQTKFDFDDLDDTLKQNAVGAEVGIMGINLANGLTFKGSWQNSVVWSKTLNDIYDESGIGYGMNLEGGLGWSPVHTERFLLSALGMVGFGLSTYNKTAYYYDYYLIGYDIYRVKKSAKNTYFFYDIYLGFDVMAMFYITERFGLYGNLGYRVGTGGLSASEYGSHSSFSGSVSSFVPTVGFTIKM